MDNQLYKNLPQKQEKVTTPEEKAMIDNFMADISKMLWEHEQIMPNPGKGENKS